MSAKDDKRVERKVRREWNLWVNARIKDMEDDLVSLLGRVERLKANLAAAKWVKKYQGRKSCFLHFWQ